MTTNNDKAYLEKIDGESKQERRRRLNRLSQQRRREKIKLTNNDKAYLEKIDDESKQERRRRLNRLSQQRRREKIKLLKPASRSNVKSGEKLSDKDLKAFQSLRDKLNEFIKRGAKVRELPEVIEAIEELLNRVKQITKVRELPEAIKVLEKLLNRAKQLQRSIYIKLNI